MIGKLMECLKSRSSAGNGNQTSTDCVCVEASLCTLMTTRAALGAVEPLGRHQYLKHELHAIGPSIKLSKYSALTR